MTGNSKPYQTEEQFDYYGSEIYNGDLYAEFYEDDTTVHLDNIFEYLEQFHGDVYVQIFEIDSELIDYLKEIYDCEVYKKW